MDTISNYKDRALISLEHKWGFAAMSTLIYVLIYGGIGALCGINGLSVIENVLSIILLPLAWGYIVMWLGVAREERVNYVNMFDGFKDYAKILITMLLVGLYTLLWSLLLIVPGIIKYYSYSMTPYILKDNPNLKYDAAINESMRMMKGHKMDLFLLHLSFIGWIILCVFTLGIGFLFLEPYMMTTTAHFYEDLKLETVEE